MKILKRYKDEVDNWFEVSEEDVIKYCEGAGFWKKNTSLKVLKEFGTIQTAYSIWRLIK
jgi:hypothetical protein